MATLQERKSNLDKLAAELAAEREKTTNYQARAGGFGEELATAINQRDDTYKTLDNDVNTARNTYYNTSELEMPRLKEEYGDDPTLLFNNLGRARVRNATNYQTSKDVRDRKKGTIIDFINSLVNAGNLEVGKQAGKVNNLTANYQMEEGAYNRDFAAEQARLAEAARQQQIAEARAARAAASKQATDSNTFGYVQNLKALGEQYALGIDPATGQPKYPFGSKEYVKRFNDYVSKNVNQDRSTFGSAGIDPAQVDSFLKTTTPPPVDPKGLMTYEEYKSLPKDNTLITYDQWKAETGSKGWDKPAPQQQSSKPWWQFW